MQIQQAAYNWWGQLEVEMVDLVVVENAPSRSAGGNQEMDAGGGGSGNTGTGGTVNTGGGGWWF